LALRLRSKPSSLRWKAQAPFGALWKTWIEANFGIAENTANLYIRLYQHRDQFPDAKTIADARKKLPKERVSTKPPKAEAKGGVMSQDEEPDEEREDEEEPDEVEREYDPEQALSEAILHITPETLHDEVVGLWDQSKRDEVTSLFLHDYDTDALVKKFGVRPVTAVTNQPAVAATKPAAAAVDRRV
jgi:hypothetical protein